MIANIMTDSSQDLYLAIDQGGHASRVMVFDTKGNVVVEAHREVGVTHPQPGWVEQDGDALEISILESLREIAETLGEDCKAVVSAGLATQRSNVVCWDNKTGKTLSPVISWQDRRAANWMQQFDDQAQRIRQISGLLPTAHYGVSKLDWCLKNLPAVQEAHLQETLSWGPLSSFLLFRLLSEKPIVVDPANASRTLLWDIKQRDWSKELINLFGLTGNELPESVPSQYAYGTLNLGGFDAPLTVCTGDQSAALFAFGLPKSGIANINIGTGAFLQVVTDNSLKEYPDRLLRSVVWSDAESSMVVSEATVNGAGSALQKFENEVDLSPGTIKKQLPNWLETSKNIPLYLNGVSGLGAPYWVSDFNSRFIGNGEVSEKIVAIIESVVFLLQVNLEEMRDKGINHKHIVVSGGLSVLDGLCQRLADVSVLSVIRPQQCESTAKGLAFLLSGFESSWPTGKTKRFEPESNKKLMQRYEHWREELDAKLNNG